jgi:hypothetical protein
MARDTSSFVIHNGLLWCNECGNYTGHWHYLGKRERYCFMCGEEHGSKEEE